MSDSADLIERARAVADEVLSTPEHADGLTRATLTVGRVAHPSPSIVRLTCLVSHVHDAAAWSAPNVTIRLAIPHGDEVASRVYTVRRFWPSDDGTGTVEIDVLVHHHESPAMAWVRSVAPGDEVAITGPRHHVVPATDGCDRAILLADATAIPAAYAILAQWPDGLPAHVVIATDDTATPDELPVVDGVTVSRIDAGEDVLLTALADAAPTGTTSIWGAGERAEMRAVRSWARDSGLPASNVRVFGYWRRGVSGSELDARRVLHLKALLDAGRSMTDFDDFDIAD